MRLRIFLAFGNHGPTVRPSRVFFSTSRLNKRDRQSKQQLPSSPARTRFAPSPTGYLHLGSLRTALFNYLLAKATGGQFLLRLEDTDKKRTIADAEERLYNDLRWAGLQWDEGPDVGGRHGPYKQSERTALYQEHAEKLLQSGHAYRCFCSSEKLSELARRRTSLGLPSDYDRTCDGIPRAQSDERATAGDSFVIRLRVPSEPPEYLDLVYGLVGKPKHNKKAQNLGEALYEDPVLLKSDGLPTYHLANVVDDHNMDITHVVRAAEWMSSTPKHLTLYNAFGWKAPHFAHVGLLQDSGRQKFSKRRGDLDIRRFGDQGIFPETLLNYVALYGWSHSHKSDVLSLSDLTASFDLKFTKGNTIVEPHKMMYLQKKYAARYADEGGPQFEALVHRVSEAIQQEFGTPSWFPEAEYRNPLSGSELRTRVAKVLKHTAKNFTTRRDFFNDYSYFFYDVPLPDFKDDSVERYAVCRKIGAELSGSVEFALGTMRPEDWSESSLKEAISASAEEVVAKNNDFRKQISPDREIPVVKDAIQDADVPTLNTQEAYKATQLYLRWAIARGRSGPPMHTVMAILGRDVSLQRLYELRALLQAEAVMLNKEEKTL
ncbi:Glutamate--tRNA ligase mitochondrial [Xanthoria calcicola]